MSRMVTLADDYKPHLPNSVGTDRLYRNPQGELLQCMGAFPTSNEKAPVNLWLYKPVLGQVVNIQTTREDLSNYLFDQNLSSEERQALASFEERIERSRQATLKPAAPKKTLSLG